MHLPAASTDFDEQADPRERDGHLLATSPGDPLKVLY